MDKKEQIIYKAISVEDRMPKIANENYLTISKNGFEKPRFYNGTRFETAHYEGDITHWLERETLSQPKEVDLKEYVEFVRLAANSYKLTNNNTSEERVYRMLQSKASELLERLPLQKPVDSEWIKNNELRIGNLTNEGEITLSDFYNMYLDDNCPYTPIPLTEDILLKCGFVEDGDYFKKGVLDMFYCLKYYKHLNGYYFYIQYSDSPFEWDDNTFYPISCTYKYLHQLQNLYFTLTGQELTIKL